MKRIALSAGLLLVVMLACLAMLRAQDEPAKPILADDPPVPTLPDPLQPPSPDALDPVSPTDPPNQPSPVDQPQPDALPLPALPDGGLFPAPDEPTPFAQPQNVAPSGTKPPSDVASPDLPNLNLAPPQLTDDAVFSAEPASPPSDSDPRTALTLRIVSLQTLQAKDAVRTLQQVFGMGCIIAADERSNSVILRGREEDFQERIDLLKLLDSADSAEPKKTQTRRVRSDDELQLEQRVLGLKTQLDEETAKSADQNPKDADARLKQLAQQIRSAVDESFNERQRQQLAEIEELTVRLNKLAKAVREREEKREAIIDQRVSQLIGAGARDVESSTRLGLSRDIGMGGDDMRFGTGGMRSGSVMGLPGMGGVEMGDFRPSAIPNPATTYEGTIDFDGQSQGLNLVDLAEKVHSLRKSIASELDGIELLKQRLSTFEANPDNVRKGADTGLSKLLTKATVALQQKRAELTTYKQLLSIEIDAAQGERFRTTQELNRVRLLHEKGAVPTRQVLDADGAAAKSNTALVRLKVLMELIQNIEQEATPTETELPASESKREDLAPKVR